MSSKKGRKEPEQEIEVKPPLMERPKFRLAYTMGIITFFSIGIILLILYYSVWNEYGYTLFIALGVLGLGVIMLTMRSSYRSTSPAADEKEQKDEDTLQMRSRR
jgi:hypothetical protein